MPDRIFRTPLNNYNENILFQFFLYPYLNKDTLLVIHDSNLLSRIYLHLYQCCIEIDNISYISGKNTYTTQEIFIWRDVPASKIETGRLLNFLEQRYRLSWLEHAEIAKSDDNNSLWIRYDANYVSIKLDKDKKTGTMKRMNIKPLLRLLLQIFWCANANNVCKTKCCALFVGKYSAACSSFSVWSGIKRGPGIWVRNPVARRKI